MKYLLSILCLWTCLPLAAGLDEGWQLLADQQDREGARTAFRAEWDSGSLAKIGWFLTFTGDGPTQALEDAAVDVLTAAPDSGAAEFVLKWMDPFRECFPNFESRVADLMTGLDTGNPELLTLIGTYERAQARRNPDTPDFPGIAKRAGFLTQWRISKRFGAYPLPAFDASWPPEAPDYWTNAVESNSPTGVVLPQRAAYGPGTYYAFARMQNPVEQIVTFRLYTFQNLALYIDGKQVTTLAHLGDITPNVRHVELPLPAGDYEVMVKVTQTQGANGQFSLQATAPQMPDGLPPGEPTLGLAGRWQDVREPTVGLAAELVDVDHPLADVGRALLALDARDEEGALDVLTRLYDRHPQSQLVGNMLANLYLGLVRFLPSDDQYARAFRILQTMAQNPDHHSLDNQMALAVLLNRAQQMRPALELLNDILADNPAYCEAIEVRMEMAAKESLFDIYQQSLALLEAMGPDHMWALEQRLKSATKEGDLDQTRGLLQRLAELKPWEGYEAELHDMNQDYAAAIADLRKRWEIFPQRDYYPYQIAKSYAELGDHVAQREWLEKTLNIDPSNEKAALDLVNLDCYEGKRDTAITRLKRFLELDPANAAFRQRLSHLQGASAFEPFRVDTTEVIEAAKNKPMSAGANSELLLDQLMVRLFADGSQMRYTHLVTRVLTKDGVDEESELQLPEDLEILELRTIKQDGSVFYPESFDNKSTISLTGIGVGDFIDEEHIEYLPPSYYDPDGLDGAMTFIFQGVERIYHHSELVLIYPEDLPVEPVLLSRNMPIEPEIRRQDGMVTVRWLTKDLPPLQPEPNMPPMQYVQPTASFYYNTTWEEIRDFYRNTIQLRMGLSEPLKRELARWRTDNPDREMAERIYEEVTERIEPNGQFYDNVNQVWETKEGSSTLLLAAIYRELGFDLDVVMVSPEQIKHYTFDTPYPRFGYALLRMNFGDETLWVDPNHKGLAFGYVPFPYRGGRGLVLNDTETFVTVPTFDNETETISSLYILSFNSEGGADGTGAETFRGTAASQLTRAYASMNKPETKSRVEQGLNQTFPGAEVSEVYIADDLARGTFVLTHTFTHPQLIDMDDTGATLPFPLPTTPLFERYGAQADRDMPIGISQPIINETTMELNLPADYRWTQVPDDRQIESRFGQYSLRFEKAGPAKLKVVRRYEVKAQFVQPQDYQDFLAFLRSMVENEDVTFTAEKDAGP